MCRCVVICMYMYMNTADYKELSVMINQLIKCFVVYLSNFTVHVIVGYIKKGNKSANNAREF